jgi:hypothetical protein
MSVESAGSASAASEDELDLSLSKNPFYVSFTVSLTRALKAPAVKKTKKGTKTGKRTITEAKNKDFTLEKLTDNAHSYTRRQGGAISEQQRGHCSLSA